MPSNQKKHPLKFCFYTCIALVAIGITTAPQIISFAIKKGYIENLKAQDIHLSWFGTQYAEDISVFDTEKKLRYSCDTLVTETSLWDLLLWKITKKDLAFIKTSTIEGGYIVSHFFGNDTIVFKDLSVILNKKSVIDIKAHANTMWKGHVGKIALEGTYNFHSLIAKLKLDDVPFLEPDELLDLTCDIVYAEDKSIANISAKSAHFALDASAILQQNSIILQKPATCTLSLSQAALKGLHYQIPLLDSIEEVDLVQIDINSLNIPLEAFEKGSIEATASIKNMQSTLLSVDNLHAHMQADKGDVNLTLTAEGKEFTLSPLTLTWNNSLSLNAPFTIASPIYLGGSLTVNQLFLPSIDSYQDLALQANANLSLNQTPLSLSIKVNTLKDITCDIVHQKIQGTLFASLEELILAHSSWKNSILKVKMHSPTLACFSSLQGNLSYIGNQKQCSLNASAALGTGTITLHASANEFNTAPTLDFSDAHIKAQIKAENLPPIPELLLPLVGNPINAHIVLDSNLSKQSCDIECSFSKGSIKGTILAANNLLQTTSKTLEITLNMPPLPSIEWTSTPSLNITISQLIVPLFFKEGGLLSRIPSHIGDWKDSTFLGAAELKEANFKTTTSLISLQNALCNFSHAEAGGPLHLNAEILAKTGKQKGTLTCTATVDEKNTAVDTLIHLEEFPSSLLDIATDLYGYDDLFSALLGEKATGSFKASIYEGTGPFSCTLSSPLSHLHASGALSKGALTLQEPFYAQCHLTEKLSRILLKEINLFSISSITAEHPISLTIDPQGVYIPLTTFSPQTISIPHLHIELGKLSCRNEGNINIALSLLKSQQRSQDHLNLWFAPADCHIEKGIIDLERTEILIADTYDVALWGSVNLIQDVVDMTLGLTADCLKKSFGVKGLPHDYVLRIPMKGPMDNVQINTSSATGKIALLLAWQQKAIAGAITGGPAGALFGEVLNSLGALPDIKEKAPPPKKPFPWEATDKRTSHNQHKKAIHPGEKPLKQLFKAIR